MFELLLYSRNRPYRRTADRQNINPLSGVKTCKEALVVLHWLIAPR